MQADNDNLEPGVEGCENWEALHEAAQRVVEACANERAHLHQVSGREEATGETDVNDSGRHQAALTIASGSKGPSEGDLCAAKTHRIV